MVHNLKTIKALILDMDGVLWRGDHSIGDLVSIFSEIKHRGFKFVLATNNATRTVNQYRHKLRRFGVVLENTQIINSSIATGEYLLQKYPAGGDIYVVGEKPLIRTLEEYGFNNSQDGDGVITVVAALDRRFSYKKLRQATILIRSGVEFIATNPDATFPEPGGLVPGAGAIVASIEAATGRSAVVIGKPSPVMYRIALERLGTMPEETLVIGDRLETDIVGAQTLGCPTALVLSGVTTLEMADNWQPPPTLIADDLSSLVELL